ncbi:MAG: hypothetical protein DYH05_07700 [Acidobacteria bacterium ACB1]|nr:hypothetical protein [Acidobacteria bacterium ACB1]RIJ89877.1 MAG: hypothetical protein DCC44_11435 [Acidobacteriota bacterium]
MNQNAQIGSNVERLFKNTIGKQSNVLTILKARFGIKGNFAKAFSTGTDAGKSDVILRFTNATLGANIKAFKAGFNQLTRLTIQSFCREFGLVQLQPIFEKGAVRVAGKAGRFIAESDEQMIISKLNPLGPKIVHFALARTENPELLVLYDRNNMQMHIYDLPLILTSLDYSITISPRGVIRIGKYITIQRKGGNGVHSAHIPKTSLSHPGNNLQIKMTVGSFVSEVAPIASYSA